MDRVKQRATRRKRRQRGIRKRIFGVPSRPRLTVFRSSKHIYAQIVDDLSGNTLVSASTVEKGEDRNAGGNCNGAKTVGARLAQRAKDAGIEAVVFDRAGFRFHGRIKAMADAAREAGLKF